MRSIPAVWLLCLLFLAACSSNPLVSRTHDYKAFIDNLVLDEKVFDQGRVVLLVRGLVADAPLAQEQDKISPGHAVRIDSDPRTLQFVVGVSVSGRDLTVKEDLQFLVDGKIADEVQEITSATLVETLYPFAYPFHHVFSVRFSDLKESASRKLEIRAPTGRVILDFSKSEGHS